MFFVRKIENGTKLVGGSEEKNQTEATIVNRYFIIIKQIHVKTKKNQHAGASGQLADSEIY